MSAPLRAVEGLEPDPVRTGARARTRFAIVAGLDADRMRMPIPVAMLRTHGQEEVEAPASLAVHERIEMLKRHAVVLGLRRVVHDFKLPLEYVALGVGVNVEPERHLPDHSAQVPWRRGIDAAAAGELRGGAQLLFAAAPEHRPIGRADRSEERRVGKECRSRWSPYH